MSPDDLHSNVIATGLDGSNCVSAQQDTQCVSPPAFSEANLTKLRPQGSHDPG